MTQISNEFLNPISEEEAQFDWKAFLHSENAKRIAINFKEEKKDVILVFFKVFLYNNFLLKIQRPEEIYVHYTYDGEDEESWHLNN